MANSFKELCKTLNIDPAKAGENQLQILEDWCHKNISTDVSYTGNLADKYKNYINLARNYLDNFLAQIPQDLSKAPLFEGMNPVQYAAYQGYDYYLKSLNNADNLWSKESIDGMTPLHVAAAIGNANTVAVLLAKGADPNKLNNNNQMPIYSALLIPGNCEKDVIKRKQELFKTLYAVTNNINKHTDSSGETILHLIAAHNLSDLAKEVIEKDNELVFISNNANLYPIHTALLNQSDNVARLLLNIDKVVTIADGKRRTPLHYAASYASPELLELCINKAVDLDAKDRNGDSAIVIAARAGNKAAVELLKKKGADASSEELKTYSANRNMIK